MIVVLLGKNVEKYIPFYELGWNAEPGPARDYQNWM